MYKHFFTSTILIFKQKNTFMNMMFFYKLGAQLVKEKCIWHI